MKRVVVYCGSKAGNREVYLQSARTLGEELVARGIGLVYGGGGIGLMGCISEIGRAHV